jgi:dTDP-4-amino-4,6-dideoxygalactose transaminase
MVHWRVPLADVVVGEDEIAAVAETYRSGWLSMGPETEAFERELADFTGSRHALAAANGTAALHLVALGAGLGAGDEVIVPSLTFVATVNAIAYTGATPVFADIAALDRPWLSAESVESAITEHTRAVMYMAYGGDPGELAAIRDLASRRGLMLLEDAAHAIGARAGGRQVGTFGLAGAYSLFSNKNLAVGEGGVAVTDDDEVAERMRLLRSHGMTTLTWDRHRGHAAGYDVVALGFNYRIDEPRSALGRIRLLRLGEGNRRRAEIARRYRQALSGVRGLTLTAAPPPGVEPAYHLFTVLLDESIDREAFRAGLAERGVQTSVHYPPVHEFSVYCDSADCAAPLPNTEAYARRTVTLPLFAHMGDDQQELVVESVGQALGQLAGAQR